MKNNIKKHLLVLGAIAAIAAGCKRDSDYVISTPSPYISNFDLRKIHKGSDVVLTKDVMRAATVVRGQVTSDHSGKNLPAGLLFIQNLRMVGNGVDSLRGIAINIGAAAADYVPGDSVHVTIEGAVLTRSNGVLQVANVPANAVQKVATGIEPIITPVSAVTMLAKPGNFEGCLCRVNKGNFDPNIGVETVLGVKTLNEGSGEMQMNVNETADFKETLLPYTANVQGIIIPSAETNVPQIWPRVKEDFVATSIVVDPKVPLGPNPAIITGYFANPSGTDANYEYIQFMATQDLDFRQKPFSVYTTNNAGASTPKGYPMEGWNTGGLRTYKFVIKIGTVAKGQFFYVGGYKQIAGVTSTDISEANWMVSRLYNLEEGENGIGSKTANLLANSGNPAGVAIFPMENPTKTTAPADVVFYAGTGGTIFGDGAGYAITDNDLYATSKDGVAQPFYRQGTNTARFGVPEDAKFSYLGGVYNTSTKQWTTKRVHKTVGVAKSATLPVIEGIAGATKLEE